MNFYIAYSAYENKKYIRVGLTVFISNEALKIRGA